jgi:hypothetical protein
MPKTRAIRIRTRLSAEHERLQGGWFVALQLVAWASLALFVVLYREPLPDEMLAAYAARWVDFGKAVH